ncbi:splicing factor 3b subunit [Babesia ovis]|uniref:Splicing factor 3b subunit n=1 Tax=Babesia ovis TaxID=5869 RepID=A0A9W5TBE5_BABOV|nr:splicing factor 3b subunit [Babesia ovis]
MPVFFHLTLQKPTGITQAVQGNFSAPKAQEIVVVRSHTIELLSPDESGKLRSLCVCEVFGIVRVVSTFRLTGTQRDYLVVGSDSGRLVILEYCNQAATFKRVHCETYGKTGIRRIVPGQYLAVDPKGRALIIGAVEKEKFVYILNRDSKANLTISSPLEAHKSRSICHDLVGLDVGFENPIFVSIEQSYEAVDALQVDEDEELTDDALKKGLSFWEMDLGLNHVVRKMTLPVDISAHHLVPIPGGDGPGGVLVCCEDFLVYRNMDHPEVTCAYPRRLEMAQNKPLMIVSSAIHKMRDFFFVLLQSEYGDIYKVELFHEEGKVKEIVCRYFDTVPLGNSICILRAGYLFVAAEFGDHLLYQFTGIGTNENDPICSSSHPQGKDAIVAFKPRVNQNLQLVDELSSLSAITDLKVIDVQGLGQPQIFLGCGKGDRSTLRVLRHGLSVEELADNELPGRPKQVWTVPTGVDSVHDGFILVGFEGNTLVLSVGEAVEEVTDSCFLTSITTLHVSMMGDGSYIQVHDGGVRHVYDMKVREWKTPTAKRVKVAASNQHQLVLALSGGELVYFELDESHTLVEVAKRSLNVEITCLSLQPTAKGRLMASFMAVGALDNLVRIMSLDRHLKQQSTQLLPNNSTPESVCVAEFQIGSHPTLMLVVGLNTGVMIRATIDSISGALSDQYTRFLGSRSVKFRYMKNQVMGTSDRPWLLYEYQGVVQCVPLSYDTLESVASFTSPLCSNGYVAISGSNLRIFRCCRLGETFSEHRLQLDYTPRKLVLMPNEAPTQGGLNYMVAVVEADNNAYGPENVAEISKALADIKLENEVGELLPATNYKAGNGKWGSCLRIVNPLSLTTAAKLLFETNEAATAAAVVVLDGLQCLCVGTAVGYDLTNPDDVESYIRVYCYGANFEIRLLHITRVGGVIRAFAGYEGRLLAAVGKRIRLYSLGKKQLLLKAEHRTCSDHGFIWINSVGSRVFAGDIREGVQILRIKFYSEEAADFEWVGGATGPRWLTCCAQLDYSTVIAGDKFDSIFVTRVPQEESTRHIQLENVCQFHLGDMPTAMDKASLSPSTPVVLYGTIMGSIGALVPFQSKDELDFLQHLEMLMATESPPLCGREHNFYRSYYVPVQQVVDGDMCEQFRHLTESQQRKVAQQLDTNVNNVLRKLDDIKNRIM